MESPLVSKKCVPCEIGTKPMSLGQAREYLSEGLNWKLLESEPLKITRQFIFKDFPRAIEFVNKVARLAKDEGHHPDIHIFYNKVSLELYTHAAKGLHENDFIMAAKINQI